MSKPTHARRRTWGFRFSAVDALAIALAIGAWVGLADVVGAWAAAPAVALGHFFLFCNVFRIRRSSELVWTGLFLLNAGAWALSGEVVWWQVLALQTPVTLGALAFELASPRYHGVFARRINGALDAYLEEGSPAPASEAASLGA